MIFSLIGWTCSYSLSHLCVVRLVNAFILTSEVVQFSAEDRSELNECASLLTPPSTLVPKNDSLTSMKEEDEIISQVTEDFRGTAIEKNEVEKKETLKGESGSLFGLGAQLAVLKRVLKERKDVSEKDAKALIVGTVYYPSFHKRGRAF